MAKSSGTRRERAAWMAGEWWGQKLQKGNPELFAAAVSRRVFDELRRGKEPVYLLCDRDPCGIIYDALVEIGIQNLWKGNSAMGVLPIKQELLVYSNCLYPTEGAGNSMPPIEIPPRSGGAYSEWPSTLRAEATKYRTPETIAKDSYHRAVRILEKAEIRIIFTNPCFASVLMHFNKKLDRTASFLWTDGISLGFNPQQINDLDLDDVIWRLCHLAMHVICKHHLRRGDRDSYLWNLAADQFVNHALDEAGFTIPHWCLQPDPRFSGLTTEEIFEQLSSPHYQDQQNDFYNFRPGGEGGEIRDLQLLDQDEIATHEEILNTTLAEALQVTKGMGRCPPVLERIIGVSRY